MAIKAVPKLEVVQSGPKALVSKIYAKVPIEKTSMKLSDTSPEIHSEGLPTKTAMIRGSFGNEVSLSIFLSCS